MKLINVISYFFCLTISLSLLGMEKKKGVSPQRALVAPHSPASPRRKGNDPVVPQSRTKKISRQLSYSDVSQDDDEKEEEEKEQAVVRFLTPKDNLPYVMRDAYKEPGLKNYKVDAFVFSQKGVIDAMNDAVADRGAEVDLYVGIHHQNKMDAYKPTKVKRCKNMHGKSIVGLDCSPSKGEPKEALFIMGSPNFSDAVWPTGNQEVMVEVKGDVPLTKKAYQLIRSNSLVTDKEIIQNTPTKRDVYSSKKTALNKSRAQRVLTVADSTDADRIAWASTMNFNDDDMADALSKAAESGADTRLIVNKSALTKNGIPLLKKMHEDGVKISVFYPQDGSRRIQHSKELIRKDLYVISNANFTDEGDFQKNLETYFPSDKKLIADAKVNFERVEQECVTLDKALELLEVTKAKTAEKNKAKAAAAKKEAEEKKKKEQEEKKSPAKKRKRESGGKTVKQPSLKRRKTQSTKK